MADALCGPSNPLQQFKQQTQLDRTLQQDRLTSRNTPLQGFRSRNPNAGVLDPEFEAFQAGLPIADLPQFHQQAPKFAGPSQTPSWATDFQRMHISSPPPPALQQQHIPQAGPATANNWAQGFQQHVAQTAPRAQMSQHSPQAFQHMARYGGGSMNGYQTNNFSQSNFAHNTQTKGKEPALEQFDDAAFELAFDQASQDMMVDVVEDFGVEKPAYETGASTGDFERGMERLESQHQARREAELLRLQNEARTREELQLESQSQQSGVDPYFLQHPTASAVTKRAEFERLKAEIEANDLLKEEEEQQQQEVNNDDDDALAATAKELLEKVEHNQTDKFKNSQFLGLMRKLRDREMKVEGDQMVDTTTADTTATTTMNTTNLTSPSLDQAQNQQNTTVTAATTLQFDNTEQTPRPLDPLGLSSPAGTATHVDTRPHDYGVIPEQYQDHDQGRINPADGQEVVDLLNQKGGASPDDIGTSTSPSSEDSRQLPPGVFYGDLRPATQYQ